MSDSKWYVNNDPEDEDEYNDDDYEY